MKEGVFGMAMPIPISFARLVPAGGCSLPLALARPQIGALRCHGCSVARLSQGGDRTFLGRTPDGRGKKRVPAAANTCDSTNDRLPFTDASRRV